MLNDIILVVPDFEVDRNRGYWPFFVIPPKNKEKLLNRYVDVGEVLYISFDGEETSDYEITRFFSTRERIPEKIKLSVLKKVSQDNNYLEIRNNLGGNGVCAIIIQKRIEIASVYYLIAITTPQDISKQAEILSLATKDEIQIFEFHSNNKTGYTGSYQNGKRGPGHLW